MVLLLSEKWKFVNKERQKQIPKSSRPIRGVSPLLVNFWREMNTRDALEPQIAKLCTKHMVNY